LLRLDLQSFELGFLEEALKEWRKLDNTISKQFKEKLTERIEQPHVPTARLSGHKYRYKIKLRSAGYRLVYEVRDSELIVLVVAVGRRDRNAVYKAAAQR
jgi:mRNA interferase RelE/StbE